VSQAMAGTSDRQHRGTPRNGPGRAAIRGSSPPLPPGSRCAPYEPESRRSWKAGAVSHPLTHVNDDDLHRSVRLLQRAVQRAYEVACGVVRRNDDGHQLPRHLITSRQAGQNVNPNHRRSWTRVLVPVAEVRAPEAVHGAGEWKLSSCCSCTASSPTSLQPLNPAVGTRTRPGTASWLGRAPPHRGKEVRSIPRHSMPFPSRTCYSVPSDSPRSRAPLYGAGSGSACRAREW
jgi:hypothetical protein